MSARTLGGAAAVLCALAWPAHAGDGLPATAQTATPQTITAQAAAPGGAGAGMATREATTPDVAPAPQAAPAPVAQATPLPPGTRSGLEIYRSFREGQAEPDCSADASARWRRHFAHAPGQFSLPGSDVLPLFGYVVDRLREVHLPTEYALIPFVESGYRPGARSPQGPAGLWQFIALTARNHKVPVRPGYDGRLSPVDSTDAAVRYLRTLHGMFAGDWRLAVMAFNAGENRVLGALRGSGQRAVGVDLDALPMPAVSQAYVRKLQALSCILAEAGNDPQWQQALARPVPMLAPAEVPAQIASLDALARHHGADAAQLRRLNPVHGAGRIARAGSNPRVLLAATSAPAAPADTPLLAGAPPTADSEDISDAMADASHLDVPTPRRHVVARGESLWAIARRYNVALSDLLKRNGLQAGGVLRPGMVLAVEAGSAPALVAE